LFRPVQPMLARTAEDTADALERLGQMALEYKLDGARIQVHKLERDVRIFSRSLKDVTAAVPEIVEAVQVLPVCTLILDGEALAFRHDGTPETFQVTMRRFGRKLEVERMRESIPLRSFFFDCLYLEDKPIVEKPCEERFAALAEALPEPLLVRRAVTSKSAEAEAFLKRALEALG
jgi:DNA ligase 1